jgi:putative DNA methylase
MEAFRKAHGLTTGGLFDQLATEDTEDTERKSKNKKIKKTRSKKSPPDSPLFSNSVSSVPSVATSPPPAGLFDQLATEDTEDTERKSKKTKKHNSKIAAAALSSNSVSSVSSVASFPPPDADLAWHVRAWGQWVLAQARKELARFYPVYADFEPLAPGVKSYERQPMRLVPLKDNGTPDMAPLNGDFSADYLAVKGNPRWVAKPTVAYLWARTVRCKGCRATIPLLKTRWLCKKDKKRVLLTMEPNRDKTGVVFGVEANVPTKGSNAAQKREHDKRLGAGTMSRAGAKCPCCGTIMTMEDIQVEAQAARWGDIHAATIVDGLKGKEYRSPTQDETTAFDKTKRTVDTLSLPFGPLHEPIDSARPSPNARGMSGLTRYGLDRFDKIYNDRQRLCLSSFVLLTNRLDDALTEVYPPEWVEALHCEIALGIDRVADRNSALCHWDKGYEKIAGTFQRYALRVNWDYCEVNPFAETTGNYLSAIEWIAEVIEHTAAGSSASHSSTVLLSSATKSTDSSTGKFDLILTDPPYYDAIPYADVSDFFYVWLRRSVGTRFPTEFQTPLVPKVEELTQHAGRFGGDNQRAKQFYEDGMSAAFSAAHVRLADHGRFVVVFAHKQPDAWETLASSMIRAGFTVDASWPIDTEMPNKAAGGARLASSVWLVCKKRSTTARPGWDNKVLDEMRANIGRRLREFWDAGIRGPDFVWAATGPALEAYSKHPVVKMADEAGKIMTVSDFLAHARRMVVDFVVGRVLSGETEDAALSMDRLDEPTAYYLLHRHDFGLDDAPAGACILYATACGLSDDALIRNWDLLVPTKEFATEDTEDTESEEEDDFNSSSLSVSSVSSVADSSSGSRFKLKAWNHRRSRSLGLEAPGGRPIPIIDRIHRLMQLWKGGDVHKVDEYLDEYGLRRHELFRRVLQSLIELSRAGGEERSLLESLSNHIGAKGAKKQDAQPTLLPEDEDN